MHRILLASLLTCTGCSVSQSLKTVQDLTSDFQFRVVGEGGPARGEGIAVFSTGAFAVSAGYDMTIQLYGAYEVFGKTPKTSERVIWELNLKAGNFVAYEILVNPVDQRLITFQPITWSNAQKLLPGLPPRPSRRRAFGPPESGLVQRAFTFKIPIPSNAD